MLSVAEHLIERHCDVSLYNGIYIDEENYIATFLLYNLSGKLIGYQQYRPNASKIKRNNPKDSRYFTYCSKNETCMWGIETLHWKPDILFVVEGIFDAVRIHNLGYPCIAVLGNIPKPLKNWFYSINQTIIGICDPDEAGLKIANFCDIHHVMNNNDLGDSTDKEVETIINNLLTRANIHV